MTDWTQVITNLMLISGGAVVLVKAIDAGYKYFDKKKTKVLEDRVESLQQHYAELEEKFSYNREWLKDLSEDVKFIYKTIVGKELNK